VVPPEVAMTMPKERILFLASGTQAEKNSALMRLSNGIHPTVRLDRGDRLILSSRIIPGNDRPVVEMMGNFIRQGVEVISRITDPTIHASGHAHRDEQLQMIEMTRPRAFVPVHGTIHHLHRHAELAREAGVGDVRWIENGDVLELSKDDHVAKIGRVVSGKVATFAGDELGEETLRERGMLGRSGAAFVALFLDRRNGIAAKPTVVARGVPVFDRQARRSAELAVARAIETLEPRRMQFDEDVAEIARIAARRSIEETTRARPFVIVTVTRT
jgi:ribonuclease J